MSMIHTEQLEDFARRKRQAESEVKKLCQRAAKRVEQRKLTLEECVKWHDVYHEGSLLQANLFRVKLRDKEVIVADWELEGKERKIVLDPLKQPHDQVENLFRRSRKLKAGQPHAERMLKQAEDELVRLTERQQALSLVATLKELEEFYRLANVIKPPQAKPNKTVKKPPAKPYHSFKTVSGAEVWVGKSARENDKLTFHYAAGLDWWLHARDCPGSHVVIRLPKGADLDDETLNDAAELALRYSKAKGQSHGEVSLTQVKGIVPVRGTPGKVMISKHKNLRVKLDEKRWDRLKNSRNDYSSSSLNR